MNQKHKDYIFPKRTWVSKFEGKCSLLTLRRLSPIRGEGGGVRGEKKEKAGPQMVLDVVPNSKMPLGSPSASNKIAGHPERPQGGERRLLSPLAPGPRQLCSVSAAQSPAVTGSLRSIRWPRLGLRLHTVLPALFTSNCIWCFGSQGSWRPVSLSQAPAL